MQDRLPRIADWVGAAPPTPDIADTADGELYVGCFYLQAVAVLRTKHDKPYLRLQLLQRNGSVEGRVWDDAERVADAVRAGSFVGVRGRVQSFNGSRQIAVDEIAPVDVEPDELALFMARSPRDPRVMEAELDARIATVEDPPLRTLLRRTLGKGTPVGDRFRIAPAAKGNHHAYLGGLLEHSLSVAGICDFLAGHYAALVDRDLLVTGALLHDVGKTREISAEVGFPYTDEGKLLGHIVVGIEMVRQEAKHVAGLEENRLLLLLHLVASHQGKYEWQSPREPRTLEALLLHYADDLDAKTNQVAAIVDSVEGTGWSGYDRGFGREFLRHRGPETAGGVDPFEPEPPRPIVAERIPAARPVAPKGPVVVEAVGPQAPEVEAESVAGNDPIPGDEPAVEEEPRPEGLNITLDLFG